MRDHHHAVSSSRPRSVQLRARVGPAVVTIGGRLGRGVLFALRLPANFLALCSFKAQQIMLASTGTKLVAVFVAGIPLCLLGGLAYMWTSGKTLLDGMLNAYGALYKIPGMLRISRLPSRCVMDYPKARPGSIAAKG